MMKKTNNRSLILAIILFLTGGGFLGYNYYEWRNFSLESEVEFERNSFNSSPPPTPYRHRLTRLQLDPFFLSTLEDKAPPRDSQLTLRGTVTGSKSLALVESSDDPEKSWLVRKGDTVMGEKILQIQEGWVKVLVNEEETVILTTE